MGLCLRGVPFASSSSPEMELFFSIPPIDAGIILCGLEAILSADEDLGLGRVVRSPMAVIFHQCPKAAGLR